MSNGLDLAHAPRIELDFTGRRVESFTGTFTPYDNKVLIRPDPDQEKTMAGITIPDSEKARFRTGTVLAVGPGRVMGGERVPCLPERGDRVFYVRTAGFEILLNGERVQIVMDNEVYGAIE